MRKLATLFLMLACSTSTRAQLDLQKLWEAPLQLEIHLTASYFSMPILQRFDANGDGVAELVMQSEDESGHLDALQVVVLGGPGAGRSYRIEDVQTTLGLDEEASFFGFIGLGMAQGVFTDGAGGGDTYIFDWSKTWDETESEPELVWRFSDVSPYPGRLLAALDLTGDGSDELIIIVTLDDANNNRLVQVWGR